MNPPTLAVVIPVYNRPTVVLEALDSVTRQTRAPDRLIIVDDGSTDDTAENVRQWLDEARPAFPAHMVQQANRGVAAARNRGAAEATDCDILAFLDSDDIWPVEHLHDAAERLAADPAAAAVSRDRLNVDLRTGEREHIRLDDVGVDTTLRFFLYGPPGLSNTVYRGQFLREIGGYVETMRCGEEDYHLMLRMSLRGGWLHAPGEPVLYRRGTPDARGGGDQLSKRCADRRLHLAQAFQRFIDDDGGRDALSERVWRRRLGRLWYSAGRQLRALDRPDEAAECFGRAVDLTPWHLRAGLRYLMRRGEKGE